MSMKERLTGFLSGVLITAIAGFLLWAHLGTAVGCDKLIALNEQQRQADQKLIADLQRNDELRAGQAARRVERELRTVKVSIDELAQQVKETKAPKSAWLGMVERVVEEPMVMADTKAVPQQEPPLVDWARVWSKTKDHLIKAGMRVW